jgi:hypothetical protein
MTMRNFANGHGILIYNGSIMLYTHITVSNCWGDGIYLGGSPMVTDIIIENVVR